jgi:hypothetical protein
MNKKMKTHLTFFNFKWENGLGCSPIFFLILEKITNEKEENEN